PIGAAGQVLVRSAPRRRLLDAGQALVMREEGADHLVLQMVRTGTGIPPGVSIDTNRKAKCVEIRTHG
ncbi:hypothetical protein QYE73_26125, partial [Pseudomonas mosselii]|uniref:hypothetical protein n=1 Tax=Pseudomonas mosselii TaxID=78327 RepID=UPI002627E2CC